MNARAPSCEQGCAGQIEGRIVTNQGRHRRLFLCAGLQSGGTTLVSWCFLQRRDMNGVLDMGHDFIQTSFEAVREPIVWCKMTVASFRWLDVYETYQDLGWSPDPLLVVRDARTVFSSLRKKEYGFNGTTAEDPPLRMRFRRFLEDWQLFRLEGWPILRFEDVLESGTSALQAVCKELGLPWDDGMTSWPKKRSQIAYVSKKPNQTFDSSTDKGSLAQATIRSKAGTSVDSISRGELDWLEDTFSTYNDVHGYPAHVVLGEESPAEDCVPQYGRAGKHRLFREVKRLAAEVYKLQEENRRLRDANTQLVMDSGIR